MSGNHTEQVRIDATAIVGDHNTQNRHREDNQVRHSVKSQRQPSVRHPEHKEVRYLSVCDLEELMGEVFHSTVCSDSTVSL